MKQTKEFIPTIGTFVDAEEEELYKITESDEYVPVNVMTPALRDYYANCAQYTLEQRALMTQISVELSAFDLNNLNKQAAKLGMPSNIYIASILHQAVS